MNKLLSLIAVALLGSVYCPPAEAITPADSLDFSIGIMTNASSGRTAPYMLGSWNDGILNMKNSAIFDAAVSKQMSRDGRFDWGAGAEILTGYQHSLDFARYDGNKGDWTVSEMRPAAFTIQQLYAEARYRSLWMLAGMKPHNSKIVDSSLSSGDLVRSNNARPIPGITVGFIDFQDIPFTNGWLQIDGQIMYGKFFDNDYRRKQYNQYNALIATDIYYTYKYCYFRTKPSENLSVIFGMQTAGQFGGTTTLYRKGQVVKTEQRGFRVKDIFKMFFPTLGNGNAYYEGNSLGSWSLRARYRLDADKELAFYWEKPFEDGSGIACRNGMDGLYGLQFSTAKTGWLTDVVVEYLDFTNQSGPLHWAPGDNPGTTITTEATGGDNYYNNDTYGSYVNYGMAIGSPMVMSPIYNADGYPEFVYNRMRGAHLALAGKPTQNIGYRLMCGWQKGYAMGRLPLANAKTDFSAMAEVDWNASCIKSGLNAKLKIGFDSGELRGDNFGASLAISYSGCLNFKRK